MRRQDLLKKYLEGKLTDAEFEALMADLNQAEATTAYDPALAQLWKEAENSSLPPPASGRLIHDFKQKLRAENLIPVQGREKNQKFMRPLWYSTAAAVALLALGMVLWLLTGSLQTVEYATGNGETRTLMLPDNSTVVLNANSSIRYQESWNAEQPREVWLDGEAYFSVVHTQNHQRFQVNVSDKLKVEVLGTEFNVKDRRGNTQVVLNTGKVKLDIKAADKAQTVNMQPGELVEFSGTDKSVVKKQVNPELYAAWRHHKMMFEEMTLQEIARILEDNYGISITIQDSVLANTRLTGAFPTHNLEMILTALPALIEMEVESNEDAIIFKPK